MPVDKTLQLSNYQRYQIRQARQALKSLPEEARREIGEKVLTEIVFKGHKPDEAVLSKVWKGLAPK